MDSKYEIGQSTIKSQVLRLRCQINASSKNFSKHKKKRITKNYYLRFFVFIHVVANNHLTLNFLHSKTLVTHWLAIPDK